MRALEKFEVGNQALLFGRNDDHETPSLGLPLFPVVFDTEALPFPLPGMSDKMPYRSTVYSAMSKKQIGQWKAAFREALEEALVSFRPDLILCHHVWLLASLCVETGIPVVAFSHGTDLRQAAQNPSLLEEAPSLSGLFGVVALTRGQIPALEAITGLPSSRIYVAGSGYDADVFYQNEEKAPAFSCRDEEVHFLYAGKIADAKGVFELVEAFHGLSDPCIRLDVFGNRSAADEARFAHFKDPRIHYHPAVPQMDLAREMRTHDVFVLSSYYEGLPLIAVEALASGSRLIVTDLPSLHEFLGDEVWAHPHISVVPMPPLEQVDCLVCAARGAHLVQLQQAIQEQAVRVRHSRLQNPGMQDVQNAQGVQSAACNDALDDFAVCSLSETVRSFTWEGLAAREWAFIESLL